MVLSSGCGRLRGTTTLALLLSVAFAGTLPSSAFVLGNGALGNHSKTRHGNKHGRAATELAFSGGRALVAGDGELGLGRMRHRAKVMSLVWFFVLGLVGS